MLQIIDKKRKNELKSKSKVMKMIGRCLARIFFKTFQNILESESQTECESLLFFGRVFQKRGI